MRNITEISSYYLQNLLMIIHTYVEAISINASRLFNAEGTRDTRYAGKLTFSLTIYTIYRNILTVRLILTFMTRYCTLGIASRYIVSSSQVNHVTNAKPGI